MAFNLLKKYPELLELASFNEHQRTASLMGVFVRDIEQNEKFFFRSKQIRPLKKTEGISAMQVLFAHLTTREDKNETGNGFRTRCFEIARSIRLHWIKHHIEELQSQNVFVFSYEDRINNRGDVVRTYIYDAEEQYVIILEPQRSGQDYYLLTAYYLNEPGSKKQIEKKLKKRLPEVL